MKRAAWATLLLLCNPALVVGSQSGSSDVPTMTATEEKKRVPKDEDEKRKQEEAERAKHAATESNDDASCWGMCFFDAIGSLFSSDENTTEVSQLGPTGATSEGLGVLGSGVLLRADSLQATLPLWSGPGGAAWGHAIVATLTPGTPVDVTNRTVLEEHAWLEVQTRSSEPVVGWVPASTVDWVSDFVPVQTTAQPAAVAPPPVARPPSGLVLGVDLSFSGLAGPADVRGEYKVFVRGGVHAVFPLGNTFQMGLGAGYGEADGEPQYDYEYLGDTRRDSPHNSRVQISDMELRVGQYMQVRSRGRFYWGVGVVYNWVRESADVDTYSLPSGLPLASSHVSKSRWRWGADFAAGGSYLVSDRTHAGLQARVFWIPWEGERLESLTLDHIGKRTIVGVGVCGTLSFDVF